MEGKFYLTIEGFGIQVSLKSIIFTDPDVQEGN